MAKTSLRNEDYVKILPYKNGFVKFHCDTKSQVTFLPEVKFMKSDSGIKRWVKSHSETNGYVNFHCQYKT
jgi:hypothetical protein